MMTAAIAAIVVIGFLFSVGCGCGCCYCTSCSQADDEAATFDVTITGVIDGSCCTGCSNANGTYSVTFYGATNSSVGGLKSPLAAAYYGCQYGYENDYGVTILDCTACPDGSVLGAHEINVALAISSDQDQTSSADCTKTLTTVSVSAEPVAGWLDSQCYMANFQDLADPILDCSLASYNARDIPYTGAVAEPPTVGCDWWTTPATCTVTRT